MAAWWRGARAAEPWHPCGRREGDPWGPARAGSGGLRFRSDRGLSAPPLRSPYPVFSQLRDEEDGARATRACLSAGDGRRGRLGQGDEEEARQHHPFIAKHQSSSALPSRPTSPPSSPPISQPSAGRRRTLDQPRHAGSPPPQPRYTHRPPESHLPCELRSVPPTHAPASFRKVGRFVGSSGRGRRGRSRRSRRCPRHRSTCPTPSRAPLAAARTCPSIPPISPSRPAPRQASPSRQARPCR